jgi:FKBP-type peptidyl-prolyl cis-trans isomerases 1
MVVGDGTMIRGWDQAIATMRVGEKALVHVQDAELFGYGQEGVKGFVPPNAELDLEIEILDVEDAKAMGVAGVTGMTGSGDLGMLDPSKPVSCCVFMI